jgi:hypothetical protein
MKNTTELTKLLEGRIAISNKWVFRIKRKANSEIDRYRARLVARGLSQTRGIDFQETFAPIAKLPSIRTMLALAVALDLEIHQMDVKSAFLNRELEEVIYMVQPEGYEDKE